MDLLVLSNILKEEDIIKLGKKNKYDSVILANGYRHEQISKDLPEKIGCEVIYLTSLSLNREIESVKIKECGKSRFLLLLNYHRLDTVNLNKLPELAESNKMLNQKNYKTLDISFAESRILKVEKRNGNLFHYLMYTYNRVGKPSISIRGNIIKVSHFLTGSEKVYAELSYNSIKIKNMNDVLEEYKME